MLGGRFGCKFICCDIKSEGLLAELLRAGRGDSDGDAIEESLVPVLIDNLGGAETSSITALHQCAILKQLNSI